MRFKKQCGAESQEAGWEAWFRYQKKFFLFNFGLLGLIPIHYLNGY